MACGSATRGDCPVVDYKTPNDGQPQLLGPAHCLLTSTMVFSCRIYPIQSFGARLGMPIADALCDAGVAHARPHTRKAAPAPRSGVVTSQDR